MQRAEREVQRIRNRAAKVTDAHKSTDKHGDSRASRVAKWESTAQSKQCRDNALKSQHRSKSAEKERKRDAHCRGTDELVLLEL